MTDKIVRVKPYRIYKANCPHDKCGHSIELPQDYTDNKADIYKLDCPGCGKALGVYAREITIENL